MVTIDNAAMFESFANSERYKTQNDLVVNVLRLRALLIQKDTKLPYVIAAFTARLRALLIQKDTKRKA